MTRVDAATRRQGAGDPAEVRRLWEDLAPLYPQLRQGALRGHCADLHLLIRAKVQILLDLTGPPFEEEDSRAAFVLAGLMMACGALALAVSTRLSRLDALGEDTRAARRALRLCLADPRAAPVLLDDAAPA